MVKISELVQSPLPDRFIVKLVKETFDLQELTELLETDRPISREIRDLIIELLGSQPLKRPKGRPKVKMSHKEFCKILLCFELMYDSGLSVEDTLETMVEMFGKSVGSLKEIIYSDLGRKFRDHDGYLKNPPSP